MVPRAHGGRADGLGFFAIGDAAVVEGFERWIRAAIAAARAFLARVLGPLKTGSDGGATASANNRERNGLTLAAAKPLA